MLSKISEIKAIANAVVVHWVGGGACLISAAMYRNYQIAVRVSSSE